MADPLTPSAVPPPTSEVTVRTLASDIEAVKAAGGSVGLGPQGVTVTQMHPVKAGADSHLVSSILGWLAVFLAVLAFAAGSWFAYRYFESRPAAITTQQPTAASSLPVATIATSSGTLASLPQTVPTHASLLTKPASTTVSFPLIAHAGTLETRFQLLRDGLDKVPATVRVAELVPTNDAGLPLSFPGYATVVGAQSILGNDVFPNYFQDDFTLLGVRGQGGFSAAYILTLKPNTAWLYVEPSVRAMEQDPSLPNLFLQLPGVQSRAFADGTVQDNPVRTATYENPAGTLTYGYFRDRLIIATSQQALDQALLLLCFAPGTC